VRSVKADTQSALSPAWPLVNNLKANFLGGSVGTLGSEREGTRHENYVLTLVSGSKTWTCSVTEMVWNKYQVGATAPLKVRLTGGVDCDSLK
jgi:hypothetical protein